jgi:hypothetical protein
MLLTLPGPVVKFGIAFQGKEKNMPVSVTFSDVEQQKIEAIVIDKDKDEALRYCSDLLDKIKEHPGHACGPKVV